MPFSLKRFLIVLLPIAAGLTAPAATTQISPDKPVINFRLPNFTPEGFRSWLVRGSEAYFLPKENQINIKELTLSQFSGKSDGKLLTMMLSPTATVFPNESLVTGDSTIRVINDDFEASGTGWRGELKEKKIHLNKNVRVVFHAEFKELLK